MYVTTLLKLAKERTTHSWQAWDGADEDGWEDVAEVPDVNPQIPKSPSPSKSLHPANFLIYIRHPGRTPLPIYKSTSQDNVHASLPADNASLPADNVASLSARLRTAINRPSAAERKVIALTRVLLQRANDSSQHEARLNARREQGEKLSVFIPEKQAAVRSFKALFKERDSELLDSNSSVSAIQAKLEDAPLPQLFVLHATNSSHCEKATPPAAYTLRISIR